MLLISCLFYLLLVFVRIYYYKIAYVKWNMLIKINNI